MTKVFFKKGIVLGIIVLFLGTSVLPSVVGKDAKDKIMNNERYSTELSNSNIVSDFESGLDGWTAIEDCSIQWVNSGGNPGGYLKAHETGSGGDAGILAPSKFLGNWINCDSFSVDEKRINPSNSNQAAIFYISGSGGSAKYTSSVHPSDYWITVTVPIQESSWQLLSGTWATLISQVNVFRIRVEFDAIGPEYNGFDNIILYANQPPNTPTISGPTNGIPGTLYDYILNSIDPEDNNVKYIIDWGDGKTDTTGLYPSGENAKVSHFWSNRGFYIITVKAEDIRGAQSNTATFNINIPRNRIQIRDFFDYFSYVSLIIQKLQNRLGQ